MKETKLKSPGPVRPKGSGPERYEVADGAHHLAAWMHRTETDAARWVVHLIEARIRVLESLRDGWMADHPESVRTA